jgi:uncharacterized protein (DUF4415 family)
MKKAFKNRFLKAFVVRTGRCERIRTFDPAQLRPLTNVLPDFYICKTRITIKIDDAVLQAYKARASGRGYQTLINETLHDALRKVELADVVRAVVREKLNRQT